MSDILLKEQHGHVTLLTLNRPEAMNSLDYDLYDALEEHDVLERLLQKVKDRDPSQFTKSGLMVGLGETKEEVMQVMDDMRSAGVDFITCRSSAS